MAVLHLKALRGVFNPFWVPLKRVPKCPEHPCSTVPSPSLPAPVRPMREAVGRAPIPPQPLGQLHALTSRQQHSCWGWEEKGHHSPIPHEVNLYFVAVLSGQVLAGPAAPQELVPCWSMWCRALGSRCRPSASGTSTGLSGRMTINLPSQQDVG